MGVPGRHRGWSWAPLMGPAGRDPNVQGSSGARGQAQRGQQGTAERSAEDPEPQRNDKWGPAHHWSGPIRDRPVCLKDPPEPGGTRKGLWERGRGAAFLLREGAGGGARGEIMATPTPPTLPAAQMRSLPGRRSCFGTGAARSRVAISGNAGPGIWPPQAQNRQGKALGRKHLPWAGGERTGEVPGALRQAFLKLEDT
ncbi:unnamed protein product [Rangifer tarandus platyrhynchus]|uniref:Uncharacterized protein n=2 Tax=Rangifer tarandus platyrhynchus TaxID=3082113 RepID=A0ABN8ZVF2_RANTA|nr:unnamed protein product [Rangifer tarandus platyrhynchus]